MRHPFGVSHRARENGIHLLLGCSSQKETNESTRKSATIQAMSDLYAKKSLGQHWLNDDGVLNAICDVGKVTSEDTVLEIGPGQGSLTTVLLNRGAQVTAVELDERLGKQLDEKFKSKPFILNMLSILDFDLSTLPIDYKVVANIPYYLTAHLLRMLCETLHKPQLSVLLVQKEVAQRVASGPGDMSLISVAVQLSYEVSLGRVVQAKLFMPPPKVDSQILILARRDEPMFADADAKKLLHIVKAGFANRRKTLLNSLSAGLQLPKDQTTALIEQAGVKLSVRAQELSLDDWHSLYLAAK